MDDFPIFTRINTVPHALPAAWSPLIQRTGKPYPRQCLLPALSKYWVSSLKWGWHVTWTFSVCIYITCQYQSWFLKKRFHHLWFLVVTFTYNFSCFRVMLLKIKLSTTNDIAKHISFLFIWKYILILNLLNWFSLHIITSCCITPRYMLRYT